MSLSFNEFQKQLRNRKIDPPVAFMLAVIYERLTDIGQQQLECAKICEVLANAVGKTVAMQQADQANLKELFKRINPDRANVTSEPISNEPV